MNKPSILALFFLCAALPIFAQQGTLEFIENKGQWDQRVRFRADAGAAQFYVTSTGFTVVQHNAADYENLTHGLHGEHSNAAARDQILGRMRSHAYAVSFEGANPAPQVVADKQSVTLTNYFIGSDPSKWASGCKTYAGVTLKNLYPNIDIRYYTEGGRLKYDLIVKPGGDPSRIALKYDGADGLSVAGKTLEVKTSTGTIKELEPYSYQAADAGRKTIPVKYSVKGNTVRFDVKAYDRNQTLVIDPTLIFSSFSGSRADNWGFTATYDIDGNFYGGGIVFNTGFPVSPGAFQSNFVGGSSGQNENFDIGIIKLSADGSTRLYATYIGGNGADQPHSLIADDQGNLVIAGRTNSSNYPALTRQGSGGGFDIIITKLNAAGTALIGSMEIGGGGDDGVNISAARSRTSLQYNYGDDGRSEVNLDAAGNIYVTASSVSGSFFITPGVFQPTRAGLQDAVLIKLNPSATSVLFSSYLGGPLNDAGYVVSINPINGIIYVGGGTQSTNFSSGAKVELGAGRGGVDGYVSMISSDGSTLINTAFIGTASYDQVYGVKFDRKGFPYITGQTRGSFPISSGIGFSQAGGSQFIAKLRPDLSAFIYSTCFGAGGDINISPTAFLVDRCENVYVSGWGGTIVDAFPNAGTFGLRTTSNAIQPNTDGKDFYFFVLERDGRSQLYGDFFGQVGGAADHVDGGTSRFDDNGVIYQSLCANCLQPPKPRFPTTPGAWAEANGSDNCNMAMVKIELNLAGVAGRVRSSINGADKDTAGCVPLPVEFRDTIGNAQFYLWNFGDGTPEVRTDQPNTSHTFQQVGTYRVRLIAVDSTTCNISDTSFLNIKVGSLEVLPQFTFQKLQPCAALNFQFNNTSLQPAIPFKPNSFIWDFGDSTPRVIAGGNPVTHSFRRPGTYTVKLIVVDTNYCNAPDSIEQVISVSDLVRARFQTPRTGCVPYAARFTNQSAGGQTFNWTFGDGIGTSTDRNPTYTYTVPGTYTVKLVVIDSNTCNIIDSISTTIQVFDNPTADFTVSPQPPVINTVTQFTNLSSTDAVRFKWLFGDGDSLETRTRGIVEHEYNTTGTFNACLIAFNSNNCSDTICKPVQTLVDAAVDVPNAFTPGRGDGNSVLFVRGFGIGSMRFTIWNRWGQKVFETTSRRIGWDGRFNGVLQPMDVYAYTLEVQFTDGTRTTKTGDITLIR